MKNEVASRYSEALFELAKENGTLNEKKEQAQSLLSVISSNEEFKLFLSAIKISNTTKKEMIDTIFKEYLDEDMIHFLKLLLDKNRTYYLSSILENFISLANEELGIVTGTVQSARPLKNEDMQKIKNALETKLKKKVSLENKINPSLIAGIKVTVGNTVTDVTVKRQMDEMKKTLLKGGLA